MQREPMKREALYALVWSTPMSRLAPAFQMSDRGMGKHCERERIPVPPRGYWAKLAAGKKVEQVPLPPLGANQSGWTWIAPEGSAYGAEGREWLEREFPRPGSVPPEKMKQPDPPSFEFDMHVYAYEALRRLGQLRVRKSELSSPHNEVQAILAEDRQSWLRGQLQSLRGPGPRRRLALLNTLLRGIEMLGGSAALSEYGREVLVRFEKQELTGRLESRWRRRKGAEEREERLVFRVLSGKYRQERFIFEDGKSGQLEDQVRLMCCCLALAAELGQRERGMEFYRFRLEVFEDELRDAERKRLAACEAAAERLREQSQLHREAEEVRRFIAAVRDRFGRESLEFARWQQWALVEADQIDPLAREEFDFAVPG